MTGQPDRRPLAGMRVVEFTAKGPVPLCTMLLADMGAEVIQVARPDARRMKQAALRFTDRGKKELVVDLKSPRGTELVQRLVSGADVLVEGFRPGAMERLGLGPDACVALNKRLVYARITGWGQGGPLASRAGHDINFLALTGALDSIGTQDGGPVPPLNLLADFAGGSLSTAFGICAALLERERSGEGQVIDSAMTDGVLSLMTPLWAIRARGDWTGARGTNFLDGGAPYYAVYQTKDGRHLAVGAMEHQFRQRMFAVLGMPAEMVDACDDRSRWLAIKSQIAAVIASRTLEEWAAAFEGQDACVTPVATLDEALDHPAMRARQAFVAVDSHQQPAPAPRLSRTPAGKGDPVAMGAAAVASVLQSLDYNETAIAALIADGIVS